MLPADEKRWYHEWQSQIMRARKWVWACMQALNSRMESETDCRPGMRKIVQFNSITADTAPSHMSISYPVLPSLVKKISRYSRQHLAHNPKWVFHHFLVEYHGDMEMLILIPSASQLAAKHPSARWRSLKCLNNLGYPGNWFETFGIQAERGVFKGEAAELLFFVYWLGKKINTVCWECTSI